jgi:hypothetical protein
LSIRSAAACAVSFPSIVQTGCWQYDPTGIVVPPDSFLRAHAALGERRRAISNLPA